MTPRLVGKSVGLHPVWLMFALSAFGSVFGFVGMLVAVPVAASHRGADALWRRAVPGQPALYAALDRARDAPKRATDAGVIRQLAFDLPPQAR